MWAAVSSAETIDSTLLIPSERDGYFGILRSRLQMRDAANKAERAGLQFRNALLGRQLELAAPKCCRCLVLVG